MSILTLKRMESLLNDITLMKILSVIRIEDNVEEIRLILIIRYQAIEISRIVQD